MKNGSRILLFLILVFTCLFSGCTEQHYYHRYHQHSRKYNERHHTQPESGGDLELHP